MKFTRAVSIIILLIGATSFSSLAQQKNRATWFGPQNVINNMAKGASGVYAADLDGDGDQDLLSAARLSHRIVWYENLDQGIVGSPSVLNESLEYPTHVRTSDLDGDGRTDIVAASDPGHTLVRHMNAGEAGFTEQRIISSGIRGIREIRAADLTGSGNKDIMVATYGLDSTDLIWFKNLNGAEFSTMKKVSNEARYPKAIDVADVDGDGHKDILWASNRQIGWYKNNGEGEFGVLNSITTDVDYISDVIFADIDGDGDSDIISASKLDSRIVWYENQEGQFGDQQIITTEVESVTKLKVADLNSDTHGDLLWSSRETHNIGWIENHGEGTFGETFRITDQAFGVQSIFATDLNGDGKNDIAAAQRIYDNIVWYENSPMLYAENDRQKIEAGESLALAILDNDYLPHKDVTSIAIQDTAGNGTSEVRNDTLFYQPLADFSGMDSLSYVISDTLAADTAKVYIRVMDTGQAPLVRKDTFKVQKGKRRALAVLENDEKVNGRPLYISGVTQGEHGEADISFNNKQVIYSPENGYTGSDEISYTVIDSVYGNKVEGQVHIETVEELSFKAPPEIMFPEVIKVMQNDTIQVELSRVILHHKEIHSHLMTDFKASRQILQITPEMMYDTLSPVNYFRLAHQPDWVGEQKLIAEVATDYGDGLLATDTTLVKVVPKNNPPEARIGIVRQSLKDDEMEITFADSSVDRGTIGAITSRNWQFGDGETSSRIYPQHTYSEEGTYEISLSVTDNFGSTAETSKELEIRLSDIENHNIPDQYALKSNYPNPFNPTTQIDYELPEVTHVKLVVYNMLGRQVQTLVDKRQSAGRYSKTFEAGHLSSGLYIYRLEAKDFSQARKMLLIK